MKIQRTTFFVIMLLLAACTGPNHESFNKTMANATQSWNGPKWWQSFNDPLLNKFADEIFAKNLDIKIAATRLVAAQAVITVNTSKLYPDLSGTGLAFRGKNQFYPNPQTFSQAGLNMNWDLDIFGQNQAGIRVSEALAESQNAIVDDVRNMVIANLAMAVIDWRQAQETIKETNDLLKIQDEQIKILNDRAKAGLIDTSFSQRAQAQRAQTATQLPQAKALKNAAQYQIALLLGDGNDQRVDCILKEVNAITITLPSLQSIGSVPLLSIGTRPDIRAARFNLLASKANLEQAEANWWPKVSVSSFFGFSLGSSGTRIGQNPFWSLGSSLTIPILNFGRLQSFINTANAQTKEAMYTYQNVILMALKEIKIALSDYDNGLNTVIAQEEALKRRKETVAIAQERFEHGLTDMIDLTTAQTELDQATLSLIAVKRSTAHAFIV